MIQRVPYALLNRDSTLSLSISEIRDDEDVLANYR